MLHYKKTVFLNHHKYFDVCSKLSRMSTQKVYMLLHSKFFESCLTSFPVDIYTGLRLLRRGVHLSHFLKEKETPLENDLSASSPVKDQSKNAEKVEAAQFLKRAETLGKEISGFGDKAADCIKRAADEVKASETGAACHENSNELRGLVDKYVVRYDLSESTLDQMNKKPGGRRSNRNHPNLGKILGISKDDEPQLYENGNNPAMPDRQQLSHAKNVWTSKKLINYEGTNVFSSERGATTPSLPGGRSAIFSNESDVGATLHRNNVESISKEKFADIKRWVEMYKEEGGQAPDSITERDAIEILNRKTYSQKTKFLRFLFLRQYHAVKEMRLKEKRAEMLRQRAEKQNSGHIKYGLWKNTMFVKTLPAHIKSFYNNRVMLGHEFNQNIVIDCAFDNHMNHIETSSFAQQVKTCFIHNRFHPYPFNIHLCNFNKDDLSIRTLIDRMANMHANDFPASFHPESYLDIFPRDKLVYLSPDANTLMQHMDPDAVYIIGGFVDKGEHMPLTLSKAKKERIKIQKLPLDRHIIFKGQKSLGIHIVLAILLDIQLTGDWRFAFRHIPRRLVMDNQFDSPSPWDLKGRDRIIM